MNIQKLRLQNFRCFGDEVFTFDKPFVIIEGENGSGKTSLLEALHYACYLRSFRTRSGSELVRFDDEHFFIQVDVEESDGHPQNIQVGLSGKTKSVKLNKKPIKSYKELVCHYRVIAAAEDDLGLVKGAPELRRSFLDQALAIEEPDFVPKLRYFKQILHNRNGLLFKYHKNGRTPGGDINIWTNQLTKATQEIQDKRINYLERLEEQVNILIDEHFPQDEYNVNVKFEYKAKEACNIGHELRFGRSLFGAHLDDFSIIFRSKRAKIYASRGQQKLVIFLIKVAQYNILHQNHHFAALLLDDFLTDLDSRVLKKCLEVLSSLNCQVFITCPLKSFLIGNGLKGLRHTTIKL